MRSVLLKHGIRLRWWCIATAARSVRHALVVPLTHSLGSGAVVSWRLMRMLTGTPLGRQLPKYISYAETPCSNSVSNRWNPSKKQWSWSTSFS